MYSYNIIAQKSTSDVISDPNEWSHSYTKRKESKNTKTIMKHGNDDMVPLQWNKISRECDTTLSSKYGYCRK